MRCAVVDKSPRVEKYPSKIIRINVRRYAKMFCFFIYPSIVLIIFFVWYLKILYIDSANLKKYCSAKGYKILKWSYNPYYYLSVDKFLLYGVSGAIFRLIAQDQSCGEIRGWVRCDKRGARFAGDDGSYDQITFTQ